MSLDAALRYHRSGWVPLPTFEIRTRDSRPVCSCPAGLACASPGKHPRVRWRELEAPDEDQIATWWRRWPGAGIALRTGGATGLVVLDVDPAHGGDETLEVLTRAEEMLPATLAVATGGGGRHYYFSAPGAKLGNDAGRALGPGLDVRADGGIVIAPPTRHLSGRRYQWADGPLAPLPAWIAARLERAAPPTAASHPAVPELPAGATRYGAAALAEEGAAVARAAEGFRNHTLNRAAFRMGQLVSGGEVASADATDYLLSSAMTAGLSEVEARGTIDSGLAAGHQSPRHAPARHNGAHVRRDHPERSVRHDTEGLGR